MTLEWKRVEFGNELRFRAKHEFGVQWELVADSNPATSTWSLWVLDHKNRNCVWLADFSNWERAITQVVLISQCLTEGNEGDSK